MDVVTYKENGNTIIMHQLGINGQKAIFNFDTVSRRFLKSFSKPEKVMNCFDVPCFIQQTVELYCFHGKENYKPELNYYTLEPLRIYGISEEEISRAFNVIINELDHLLNHLYSDIKNHIGSLTFIWVTTYGAAILRPLASRGPGSLLQ